MRRLFDLSLIVAFLFFFYYTAIPELSSDNFDYLFLSLLWRLLFEDARFFLLVLVLAFIPLRRFYFFTFYFFYFFSYLVATWPGHPHCGAARGLLACMCAI